MTHMARISAGRLTRTVALGATLVMAAAGSTLAGLDTGEPTKTPRRPATESVRPMATSADSHVVKDKKKVEIRVPPTPPPPPPTRPRR